jgi:hypothetical protein
MFNSKTKTLTYHEGNMVNTAVPIFQQIENKHPVLFIAVQDLFTVVIYAIHMAILPFNTQLGNICFITGSQER